MEEEGRSLTETPTWAVATVLSVMVTTVFLFGVSLEHFAKWLNRTRRRALLPALDKIKDELMVFGVMSLLLSHFSFFVSKICIRISEDSSRFYPCLPETETWVYSRVVNHTIISSHSKDGLFREKTHQEGSLHSHCPKEYEPLASYESLEQLHRLLFVLGVTHITYSSLAIALAMVKIYSWRSWENDAKAMADQIAQDNGPGNARLRRVCTFVLKRASHPWSEHKVKVWLLCFIRQVWSSINKSDYIALRFGFLGTHELPLSYDFLNYILRSINEEIRDIVGVSWPLWIYAIVCIFLDFRGSIIYLCISFLPAIIITAIGTKLHRIVVKLAVEIVDPSSCLNDHEFRLRNELFWFGKPRLLLRLIQFISFQNALEMAMFLWSLWEIKGTSCFMMDSTFIVVRLTFGIVSQVWCSFITFPLYVIITQMGSKFKKTVISEGVRTSLHGWRSRVNTKQKQINSDASTSSSVSSSHSSAPLIHKASGIGSSSLSNKRRCFGIEGNTLGSLLDFEYIEEGYEQSSDSDSSAYI